MTNSTVPKLIVAVPKLIGCGMAQSVTFDLLLL